MNGLSYIISNLSCNFQLYKADLAKPDTNLTM